MIIIALIWGTLLGLGLCAWQRYAIKSQLKQILTIAPDTVDLFTALSITSLVRREINYLQQQHQQQAQAIQTWQSIVEQAPIGYLQIDQENQLLWCNQQARSLLQIDRWQSGQVRLLLELVRSYELDQLIEQTRRTQRFQVQEWSYYPSASTSIVQENQQKAPQNLSNLSIALKATSYPLQEGSVAVFIENQQPLLELSRSRDRTFSDLTHELRTPLTSISLVAETLEKRLQNPEKRWAGQMLTEINRLINLVQEWLDLSQLQEYPEQSLKYESVSVDEVIQSAWCRIEPIAQQKSITLDYTNHPQIQLEVDKLRMSQVFLNLFDNSIKHSPDNREIKVQVTLLTKAKTAVEENQVQIDIIDWGNGFAEADIPYIFERLYRGDTSRTRQLSQFFNRHQGSGLGLAIVQQIIMAHGGTIRAQNHPETGGAWIQLILTQKA